MKPSIPITDQRFKYRDSASTDVRLTWAEARKAMEKKPVTHDVIAIRRKT